ncbi:hypothetical protein ZWY2020_020881 [Hordeum vulgare]|nr:hypothetical protein ZWY2020_020881 [Hordeum vulgare]
MMVGVAVGEGREELTMVGDEWGGGAAVVEEDPAFARSPEPPSYNQARGARFAECGGGQAQICEIVTHHAPPPPSNASGIPRARTPGVLSGI